MLELDVHPGPELLDVEGRVRPVDTQRFAHVAGLIDGEMLMGHRTTVPSPPAHAIRRAPRLTVRRRAEAATPAAQLSGCGSAGPSALAERIEPCTDTWGVTPIGRCASCAVRRCLAHNGRPPPRPHLMVGVRQREDASDQWHRATTVIGYRPSA